MTPEEAQIEYMKAKGEFMQGCAGCMMLPVIVVTLLAVFILISIIIGPFL